MLIRRRTPAPSADSDPVLAYALTELAWYERTRDHSRRVHWFTELAALAAGSTTVVAAGLQAPAAFTATTAGVTVFIGGFRQVFGHMERYVLASESWMRLHPEVERYRLIPEAERDAGARQRLVEQIESVADLQIRNWAATYRNRSQAATPTTSGPPP